MSASPQIRVLCTLPLEHAKQCVEKNEMVSFSLLPPAVARLASLAERPRMPNVASLPEPTKEEIWRWCCLNGVMAPRNNVPARDYVLSLAEQFKREPADIIGEMLGDAKPTDDGFRQLTDADVESRLMSRLSDPRLMLVTLVPLEGIAPSNPDEWFARPRCERCNWPLADSEENGCVVGNCSMRGAQ